MFNLQTLNDLSLLSESVELECKLAQGQDGKGEIPKDFWSTYSAMANAHGGVVLLGVREKKGQFTLAGLSNATKLKTDLFNDLNNLQKVSTNLLNDQNVKEITIDGKTILVIEIPAATRKQKPVYLNGNPLGNTYRRLHDGDRTCSEENVKRMLAEQIEDERDARILVGFGIEDIDLESLRIYRQMLKDEKPGHPFLEQSDFDFLGSLRAWRKDRSTGEAGLTLAGLLMFGKWSAIQEALPHYFVDYQERPEAKAELRWVDRLVPDGSWTGNIFEFYRKVYRKLIADLKVPFALKDGQRQDDTPVHEALREALVNTLVHADYSGRLSVLVVKRPDMFGFRNPGNMRLPLEQVLRGGESDCRNRILHQMFLMIGLGERGGSGIPKIYSGWKSQHWRPPALEERDEPEQTLLKLQMADLFPDDILNALRVRFGNLFDDLDYTARLIMATAAIERVVTHNRLLEICDAHSHDLTLLLSQLVKQGLLTSDGRSRGTVYFLPGDALPTPEDVFPLSNVRSSSEYSEVSSEHLISSSEYSELNVSSRDEFGRFVSPQISHAIVDDLSYLTPDFLATLEGMSAEPRMQNKLNSVRMKQIILSICQDHFISLASLAHLLNRNPDALRQQYLKPMTKDGSLVLAFPTTPTHEKQAYRSLEHINLSQQDEP
ncbi:MAG TPA: putative DNA binding domain-containing protein [Thiotrichales bacterium]|nr:putative DNA binding domain-containing protein [Thiotrichales bacterium]